MSVTPLPLTPGTVHRLLPHPDLTGVLGQLVTLDSAQPHGEVLVWAHVHDHGRYPLYEWTMPATYLGPAVQAPYTLDQLHQLQRALTEVAR